MTHQPDRVAQVVAFMRDDAKSLAGTPYRDDHIAAEAIEELADAIEAGEPFKETPDE